MPAERTREEREQKVVDTVREWLPGFDTVGQTILIRRIDPDQHNGSLFEVASTRAFACSRGRPAPGADAAANGMGS